MTPEHSRLPGADEDLTERFLRALADDPMRLVSHDVARVRRLICRATEREAEQFIQWLETASDADLRNPPDYICRIAAAQNDDSRW